MGMRVDVRQEKVFVRYSMIVTAWTKVTEEHCHKLEFLWWLLMKETISNNQENDMGCNPSSL
jgi:hypothetical protein